MARLDYPIEVPGFDFMDRALDYSKWSDEQIARVETNTDPLIFSRIKNKIC